MAVPFIDAVKYVLALEGCLHPFRISRILALAELYSLEEGGGRLTDARYVLGPGVFFIEGFKEAVEADGCIAKREGDPERGVRGCLYLACGGPPRLPGEAARYLERAAREARGLSDEELNDRVVKHPLFGRLAG